VLLMLLSVLVGVLPLLRLKMWDQADRAALWVVPPLAVLVGLALEAALTGLYARLRRRSVGRARVWSTVLLAALLAGGVGNAAWGLKQGLVPTQPETSYMWGVLDGLAAHVPSSGTIVLVGGWGRYLSPMMLSWAYLQRGGPEVRSDRLRIWEYPPPDLAVEHVLHFRWPWHVRLPAGPPGPPPDPVERLRRARVDTLLVPLQPGEQDDAQTAAVQQAAVTELGFQEVAPVRASGLDYRVRIFRRQTP
jgi:hypothetical protein